MKSTACVLIIELKLYPIVLNICFDYHYGQNVLEHGCFFKEYPL